MSLGLPSTPSRIVVKVGSGVITSVERAGGAERIRSIVDDLAALHRDGWKVLFVTSGAVAAGMERLGLSDRPRAIEEVQAASAVGQSILMHAYEESFRAHGISVAQVLLTHADMADRERYLSVGRTLDTLFGMGVVPIVNENDVTSVEELNFGDNDRLAAMISGLADAELLVLLTDSDGLYTADPRTDPDAKWIERVDEITPEIEDMARRTTSPVGSGGMASKIQAARIAGSRGVWVVIGNGLVPGRLAELVAGGGHGTRFMPQEERRPLNRRKHWLAFSVSPRGALVVDPGARRALIEGGRSLLPSGVREVRGSFRAGDPVTVLAADGSEIGRGLVSYGADEVQSILGRQSGEIEGVLGYRYADEVIHRDDLVLTLGAKAS